MSGFERRRLELEWQDLRWRVYSLEGQLCNCNGAITRIKGRLRSFERSLDLGYASRQRAIVSTQLAAARAREQTVARQLEGSRDRWAEDQREGEEAGLAMFAIMERVGK